MTHFGLLCPAMTGHLNTMLPLGHELQQRGHKVTLFGVADVEKKILAAGLNFWLIGESEFPLETMPKLLTKLSMLHGLTALQYTINLMQQWAAVILNDSPKALKQAGVDALLVDQLTPEAGTVAEFLEIPFITICSALPINQEDSVPPIFTPWSYNQISWARLRNRTGYALFNHLVQPVQQLIDEYRQQWKLPRYQHINNYHSQLAQISQQPAEFEFPRQHLPQSFHFTGPYHNSIGREVVSFPFEKLTGQPLIYASMGTLQNRLLKIFGFIAKACEGIDAQLVISLGSKIRPESLPKFPDSTLVVNYAPQLELLKKASLTITHAGLNTTLESLSNGVPMVAIPITNDQPGVAARLAWTGSGEVVSLSTLSTSIPANFASRD